MRVHNDKAFADFILRIGNGEEPVYDNDIITLPEEIGLRHYGSNMEMELIRLIYSDLHLHATLMEYMTNRAILATTNDHVDYLNELLIDIFLGEVRTFNCFDEAMDDTNAYYQEEFLNSLLPNGIPPHKLILKVNCPIMLLRNLDPSNGLCNGTRMICRSFGTNVIHAEVAMGEHTGKQVFIPRIPLSPPNDEGYPFKFRRKQFPVRLCFAMTINKAQGQTVPNVGIYLPQHVFSHGQLYVALSRGVSMSTTKVLVKSPDDSNLSSMHTKNIVYKEILL